MSREYMEWYNDHLNGQSGLVHEQSGNVAPGSKTVPAYPHRWSYEVRFKKTRWSRWKTQVWLDDPGTYLKWLYESDQRDSFFALQIRPNTD